MKTKIKVSLSPSPPPQVSLENDSSFEQWYKKRCIKLYNLCLIMKKEKTAAIVSFLGLRMAYFKHTIVKHNIKVRSKSMANNISKSNISLQVTNVADGEKVGEKEGEKQGKEG